MDIENIADPTVKRTLLSPLVLQLLFIMFFVEFVKGALIVTFLPVYLRSGLGATGLIIGWTMAVQYIGDNLFRTPVGWIIDKLGYRISMLSGVLATLLSVLILAFTSNFGFIIIACALLGAGTAPLWPCVITGTTDIAGEQAKGTIMSIIYMAWLSGVGLGPFVITYFMDASYTEAFTLLIGVMLAVVLVAVFLPGKKGPSRVYREGGGARSVHGKVPRLERIRTYLAEVRRSITVTWLLYPAMFAQTFAIGLLTPVLTIYATDELQLSLAQFRMFLIVGGGITVLTMIPIGKMVDRFGTKPFLNAGFGMTCVVLFVFTRVRDVATLYVLVALLGLGFALIIPSWNALIASAIPKEKRGAVWGFFLTIEGVGTTTGPIVSGVLWDYIGPAVPFLASGIVLLAVLVMQWFISIERRVVVP